MWFNHLYSWFAGFLFALKCLHVLHELRSLLKRLLNRSGQLARRHEHIVPVFIRIQEGCARRLNLHYDRGVRELIAKEVVSKLSVLAARPNATNQVAFAMYDNRRGEELTERKRVGKE